VPNHQTVLLVGGTGRTGARALRQLLDRGVRVRAIVRSRAKLPPEVTAHPNLAVIEASLLSLSDAELQQHLRGCDAVVSCLGHVISLKGVFGPPRDLVTRATTRLCRAIEALAPPAPVKFVLMSSVSVHRPGHLDAVRKTSERVFLRVLRALLPPADDNQRAADFLMERIGTSNGFVRWTAIRADSLLDGDVTKYELHDALVNSLSSPGSTNMANVAHFMCELVTDPQAWARWSGRLPVLTNAVAPGVAKA
jgi:uncharacterized protein YbjT (DUF2867 family)